MNSDLSKRPKGLLLLSLALGLMAALSVHLYLSRTERDIQDKFRLDYVPRIVSARDLLQGKPIAYDDLAIRDYPQKWLVDDSFGPNDTDAVVGSYLTADVAVGQLILSTHLSRIDTEPLHAKLKVGMRAISIPIEAGDGASHMISSGNEIDLFVTFDHAGRRTTTLLLRSVHVLAAPSSSLLQANASRVGETTQSVLTVEVTQEDAQKLIAAKQAGVISAVIRSSRSDSDPDYAVGPLIPRDLPSLLGLVSNESKQEPPQIIYGDRLESDIQHEISLTRDSAFKSSEHE